MVIPAQSILKDYRALRSAAAEGSKNLDLEGIGRLAVIQNSQIDNDPATTDSITVMCQGNGAFSGPGSAPGRLTFREVQQDGRPVLEFSAQEQASILDATVLQSQASIDLTSGMLISASGGGSFLVGNSQPVSGPQSVDEQAQQAKEIRASYQEIKEQIAEQKPEVGFEFFLESRGSSVTLDKSEPGLIEVSYWGGAFSGPGSGTITESFREYKEDGRAMLAYRKHDPGDIFDPSTAQTISRNLTL